MNCNLRPMEDKDLAITFAWRNDEEVLKFAATPNPISYNEHEAMYKYNNSLKLVFEVNGNACGFVSCTVDPEGPAGEWSFHIAAEARKKGYSEIMLKMALIELKNRGYNEIYARVKKANLPSLHLHKKLGFFEIENYTNNTHVNFSKNLCLS